jgi:hypothetical protein
MGTNSRLMVFSYIARCLEVSVNPPFSLFSDTYVYYIVAPETKQPKVVEYVAKAMGLFLGRMPLLPVDLEQATRDGDVLGTPTLLNSPRNSLSQ